MTDRITEDLLDATLKGFAIAEVVWTRTGNRIVPRLVKGHDPRRFVFDENWQPRLLTMTAMNEGVELPERKFITHRTGVKGNNPYGLGLGSRLFWPVLFKREGISFWLHFLEKFAGPTVVGKTPYGMLTDEQLKLLRSLEAARTASAITVPIGTEIELLEATRSGSVTYEQWLNYWDRQISICVTGETLTTQVSEAGGSRALGEVHQEVFEQLVDADADHLADTFRETLLTWILDYNLPGAAVPSVWRVRARNEKADAETRKAKATAAETMDSAIRAIVEAAASLGDDQAAREYIVSFEVTDALSDRTIDALVSERHSFARKGLSGAGPQMASFAQTGLKKKALTMNAMSALPNPAGWSSA